MGAVVVRGVREGELGCDGAEIMGEGGREEESGVVVGRWEVAEVGQRVAAAPRSTSPRRL